MMCSTQAGINTIIIRIVIFMEFCFSSLSDLYNILGEN